MQLLGHFPVVGADVLNFSPACSFWQSQCSIKQSRGQAPLQRVRLVVVVEVDNDDDSEMMIMLLIMII